MSLPEQYSGVQIGEKFGLENLIYRTGLKTSYLLPLQEDEILIKVGGTQLQDYFVFDIQGEYPISAPNSFPGYETTGVIVQAGSNLKKEDFIGRYAAIQMPNCQGGFCEYAKATIDYAIIFDNTKINKEQIIATGLCNQMTSYGIREKILQSNCKTIVNMMGGSNLMKYIFRMFSQDFKDYKILQVIRNPQKVDQLKQELQTDNVIATGNNNYLEEYKKFVGNEDVCIIDPIGGENVEQIFGASPQNSQLIIIEYLNTKKMNFNTEDLLWKSKSITGFVVFFWYASLTKEKKQQVLEYIKKNYDTVFETKVNTNNIYTFKELKQAGEQYLKDKNNGGKIILVPN